MSKKKKIPTIADPALKPIEFRKLDGMYEEILRLSGSSRCTPERGRDLRSASVLLNDYCKCCLAAFASRAAIPLPEELDVKDKFQRVLDWNQAMARWKGYIDEVYAMRNMVAHTDFQVPSSDRLWWLFRRGKHFRAFLESEAAKEQPGHRLLAHAEGALRALRSEITRLEEEIGGNTSETQDLTDTYMGRWRGYRLILRTCTPRDNKTVDAVIAMARDDRTAIEAARIRIVKEFDDAAKVDYMIEQQEAKEKAAADPEEDEN
jgi:hypothetical protein